MCAEPKKPAVRWLPSASLACALLCGLAVAAPRAIASGVPLPPPTGAWRWLHPAFGAPTLKAITVQGMGNDFSALAVGSGGTVLLTMNGAKTWKLCNVPPGTGELDSVMYDTGIFIACGRHGTIIRSANNGPEFCDFVGVSVPRLLPLGVPPDLICSPGGPIVASDGTLYGLSSAYQLRVLGSVDGFTPRAAWYSGREGFIVGGDGDTGIIAEDAAMWPPRADRGFNVVHTASGGVYQAVSGSFGPDGTKTPFVLAAGTTSPPAVYAAPSSSTETWTDIPLPATGVQGALIFYYNNYSDWDPEAYTEMWFGTDTGLWDYRIGDTNFERQLGPSPRVFAIVQSPKDTAEPQVLAFGEGGSIYDAMYHTGAPTIINGGQTQSYTAAAFPTGDGELGFVGATDGPTTRLLITADGGNTFKPVETVTSPVVSIDAVDALHVFALVSDGGLYATEDGGTTWTRESTVANHPAAVVFTSPTTGFVAGDGILQSTDGGATWQAVSAVGTARFVALARGPSGAVAATTAGSIWTFDRGAWTSVKSTSSVCQLATIAFEADGTIVAGGSSGNGGCVEEVSNAGSSTTIQNPKAIHSLAAVGKRLFALFADGHVSELLADGTETNSLGTGSKLNGLVARKTVDPWGNPHPAPMAFGDFGALLVFDDGAAPVLTKGPRVSVQPTMMTLSTGQVGTLTATATDLAGLPVSFSWSDPGDDGLQFGSPNKAQTTVIWAQQPFLAVEATAEVTACDLTGACSSAHAVVGSKAPTTDQAPVAVVKGTAVETGQPFFLDASASYDPDGEPISFAWKQLSGTPAPIESSTAGPVLAGDAPDTPGTLVFELKVADPEGLTGRIEVLVVVAAPGQNIPPVAMTKGDITYTYSDSAFTLDATDSYDPDDAISSFEWEEISGPPLPYLSSPEPGPSGLFFVWLDLVGEDTSDYRFVVRVCDVRGACSEARENVYAADKVPPGDKPPIASAGVYYTTTVGVPITLWGENLSPQDEYEPLTYEWSIVSGTEGIIVSADTADPRFVPTAPTPPDAPMVVQLKVCDPWAVCGTDLAKIWILPASGGNSGSGTPPNPDGGSMTNSDGGSMTNSDGGSVTNPDGGTIATSDTGTSDLARDRARAAQGFAVVFGVFAVVFDVFAVGFAAKTHGMTAR